MSTQSRNAASKPTCNLVAMLGAGFVKLKELEIGQYGHELLIPCLVLSTFNSPGTTRGSSRPRGSSWWYDFARKAQQESDKKCVTVVDGTWPAT